MKTIDDVRYWEEKRYEAELKMKSAKILRDLSMLDAFNSGSRHKEIGIASGLSEQRVKHIILGLNNLNIE